MLELKNIKKVYPAGGENVQALKGIDLQFREHEFVCILGPSGCGKTTMLNIIGGLDGYTEGDLVINGRSTKDYRDRDWDAYRNHSIGFVFQSYNLIPHQTVLQNVELALTLSGVKKAERRRRAEEALCRVGLSDQLKKKPAEMSGGQMQRVAIARAIVNDPDIILADEPTGALDTETSVQVMDILKEISKDRLVIMVTHNPDLAEQYATRTVRMLDGVIKGDSAPLTAAEFDAATAAAAEKAAADRKKKMPSMSFFTSFGLSLKNLFTKRGRTALTSFAGSIGIIGIALIYAVSQGMNDYIDLVQEDTLSSYPITITAETADMTSMLTAFSAVTEDMENQPENTVREMQLMNQVFAQIGFNDISAFKDYMEDHNDDIADCLNAVKYGYGVEPQIYTHDINGNVLQVNPSTMFSNMMSGFSSYSSFTGTGVFSEMIDNQELLDSQYDVLAGRWPEAYNEIVLVLSSPDSTSDYMAYAVGLRDQQELKDMLAEVMKGNEVEAPEDVNIWTYDELMSLDFRLVNAFDRYAYNEEYGVWEDMSDDSAHMEKLVDEGSPLKVVGIVCAQKGTAASALSPGFAYRPELKMRIIENAAGSDIVKAQLADDNTDVFSGKSFDQLADEEAEESDLDFADMISVDEDALAEAFSVEMDENEIKSMVEKSIKKASSYITANTAPAKEAFMNGLTEITTGILKGYLENAETPVPSEENVPSLPEGFDPSALGNIDPSMLPEGFDPSMLGGTDTPASGETDPSTVIIPGSVAMISADGVEGAVSAYLETDSAKAILKNLEKTYVVPADVFKTTYTQLISGILSGYVYTVNPDGVAPVTAEAADALTESLASNAAVMGAADPMAQAMTEAVMQRDILTTMAKMSTDSMEALSSGFDVDEDKIASAFSFNLDEDELMRLMESFSTRNAEKRSAENNLRRLGYADTDDPTSISIYLKDFDAKEKFIDFIEDYNEKMEADGNDDMVISYTDITGVLMSSIKTVIDAITYVLIAFVAISLVVSSIMIGVITLISVQERTKEIGILRAIGASKRNVSSMFNAETVIIGFAAGLIGVGITYLLCIPINIILHKLTGLPNLSAVLPVNVAAALVLISMFLTLIAGFIPSRSAAKKDPVVALRTE